MHHVNNHGQSLSVNKNLGAMCCVTSGLYYLFIYVHCLSEPLVID